MPATPPRRKFGDCELDEQSGKLRRNGKPVVLPNQFFPVLRVLIHGLESLLTRGELLPRALS